MTGTATSFTSVLTWVFTGRPTGEFRGRRSRGADLRRHPQIDAAQIVAACAELSHNRVRPQRANQLAHRVSALLRRSPAMIPFVARRRPWDEPAMRLVVRTGSSALARLRRLDDFRRIVSYRFQDNSMRRRWLRWA